MINAYALTFGVMIVTGGRLADMFGRRNAFFLGTAIFASMSALGGAAQSEAWLIATRTLMGIGGALMWPAILGMTYELLPEEKAGLAGGIIIGAAGLGNAIGPLIGGVFTEALSWRWIFFLNVPVSIFAILVTYFLVHVEEPGGEDRKIDYAGVTTLSVGLVSLLVALDQVDDWGWGDPRVIALLVLAAGMIAAFLPIERRARSHALVPREVLRNRSFTASCVAILFMSATFFAALLYLPQFMEKQLGYSPLESVTSVDQSQTSLAGGIIYTFQIAGGSIGLGLTTTVFSAAVPPFVDGVQAGFRLDASLSLVGLVVTTLFVGGKVFAHSRTAPEEA